MFCYMCYTGSDKKHFAPSASIVVFATRLARRVFFFFIIVPRGEPVHCRELTLLTVLLPEVTRLPFVSIDSALALGIDPRPDDLVP